MISAGQVLRSNTVNFGAKKIPGGCKRVGRKFGRRKLAQIDSDKPKGLMMSVRDPGSLSRANSEYLVIDPFLRGWRLMKKKKTCSRGKPAEPP